MTNDLLGLYAYAERRNIDVDWIPMRRATSLSVPLGDGYAIALDPWKLGTIAQETVCLAHELGHCETGSFYNRYAALDVRQRHENRADKWAIRRLVPEDDLDAAMADGCNTIPALADRFGVTEPFMRKAVCWYAHGNLAVEMYS
ncbi:ImmA/IrrE family metallo-endopeptidase [uncultured Oscillibacter sp.]|uniref:ImmA/IrrE family metallo-endopeptidase n=1 Tax=uncultured Oscillibacter sp. TaxID=876091 RepID=UPI002613F27B|nr:ImmA/IrrE family metallo-endopeptidase [uncultured Oscillibacter sp.]